MLVTMSDKELSRINIIQSGFLIHVADPAFINPDTDVTASESLFRLLVLRMTGLKMLPARLY